ncbi:MAG: 2OG-Fe(II) oxygenase [Saprospirales bacterium]|nr:2OG-Fe(II) oxygenase [Saprospirales bacterium]MBK8920988.1 2OG-Fe(II) oxygenase [Saprospirales bacterium]
MDKASFEALIAGVLDRHYGTVNSFISPVLTAELRSHLLERFHAGGMQAAGVGQRFAYERNLQVRGDVISWLEKAHHPAEKAFLEQVDSFVEYLNQTCYTGINACEFHFALYEPGTFYKRHIDQFRSDQGRRFSLVVYLNEQWAPEDAGQLVLYPGPEPIEILPEGGRAVFFRADAVEHEVMPAQRPRLSIAGWLKRV